MEIILKEYSDVLAQSLILEAKRKLIEKWYNSMVELFGKDTIENYKYEFSNSLKSVSYHSKIHDLVAFYEVKKLPEIPILQDEFIANKLYFQSRIRNKKKLFALAKYLEL